MQESNDVADRFRLVTLFTGLLKGVEISSEESEFEKKLDAKANRYKRRTGLIYGLRRWRQITKRIAIEGQGDKENKIENETVSRRLKKIL